VRVRWHDVGHLRVAALLDGEADLSTSISEAFPDLPPELLATYAARMPGIYGSDGAWHLFSRAWLVMHPGGVILVDTGLGGPGSPTASWFPEPGHLLDALREAGPTPDQVDTVVLTHLHDDHVSGAVTGDPPVPTFPRARYLIQQADVDAQRQLAAEDDEDRVIWERTLEPLFAAGVIDPLDGHRDLGDGIELRPAPGHTPGHQIVRLRSKNARLTIVADAFMHPAQLARPDLPAGTDMHPAWAAASRREILASLLSNPGTVIAPTHLDAPFGRVGSGPDGLAAWRPLAPN
jgi:glyoxylase-like metal-dependent hydrolase (beta-lactamase superfamily II)